MIRDSVTELLVTSTVITASLISLFEADRKIRLANVI